MLSFVSLFDAVRRKCLIQKNTKDSFNSTFLPFGWSELDSKRTIIRTDPATKPKCSWYLKPPLYSTSHVFCLFSLQRRWIQRERLKAAFVSSFLLPVFVSNCESDCLNDRCSTFSSPPRCRLHVPSLRNAMFFYLTSAPHSPERCCSRSQRPGMWRKEGLTEETSGDKKPGTSSQPVITPSCHLTCGYLAAKWTLLPSDTQTLTEK